MKVFALCALLVSMPAWSDTLYTFAGGNYGFTWDATTQRFLGVTYETYNAFLGYPADAEGGMPVAVLPHWPYPVISLGLDCCTAFDPINNPTPSTDMSLEMIDNDGSAEQISVLYKILGFTGEMGTYSAYSGSYNLPNLTLTVSDPPVDPVPEPGSAWLTATTLVFGILATLRPAILRSACRMLRSPVKTAL
jgi:hypothetical protein